MNSKHLWWIIPLSMIVSFVMFSIGATEEHNNRVPEEIIKQEISRYWACMDGCSNLQEMLFDYDYYNETMKRLHDDCTNVCCNQYMLTYGCE